MPLVRTEGYTEGVIVCFKGNRISHRTFHGVCKFHLKPQSWEQKVINILRFLNGVLALDIAMQIL